MGPFDTPHRGKNNSNTTSFLDLIPNNKVKTFSSVSTKVSVKAMDEKLITVNADRDLFGRLLLAANARQINLKEVLSYELSPVPCSLAHQNGSLKETTKYAFLSSFCSTDSSLHTVLERINDKLTGLPLKATIDLTDILNDAMTIYKNHSFDESCPLRINYSGQPAIDTGGPRREFFDQVFAKLQVLTSALGFANYLRAHLLDCFQCAMPK